MRSISAVIITFNEEANIGRCIDSLHGAVDEIVVIDSESTDETIAICKSKNVRVVSQPFLGYIEQKNFAMSIASHEIVLSLDADEALSQELLTSIQAIRTNSDFSGAASMHRLTNYCGYWVRHGGWYPDTKIRLMDRRIANWTGVNPHDRIELTQAITIKKLDGDLLHYSYDSISDHLQQINHFTTVSSKALYTEGVRSNLFKIIVNPIARFIRNYILRVGFLDGFFGLVIAVNSAHAVFLKYVRLFLLQRDNSQNKR